MNIELKLGNNLDLLKEMEDNSVDSIVTDPPYGLSFMNKKWDYDVPSVELWQECYRVLKPGGHLLSFSGSRTYHRMAVRIEDAGFEIRDQIMWVYGSGFPKSLNVGKAVDKLLGNEREVVGEDKCGTRENQNGEWGLKEGKYDITKGTSEWEGWGTALKPAHEPIVLARKPLSEKNIAENVLRWGTGGINIDECRIGTETMINQPAGDNEIYNTTWKGVKKEPTISVGRWPANIIFDEEAGQVLDQQSGIKDGNGVPKHIKKTKIAGSDIGLKDGRKTPPTPNEIDAVVYNDKGGASRFFYCPKANKKDRDEDNNHPTVKPTALMEYLIKLITPVNGIVMDPFMGSGSTGKAAALNGFRFIGMEREEEYYKIAEARIKNI